MRKILTAAVTVLAAGFVIGPPTPVAAAPDPAPGAMRVVRQAHTKAYVADMLRCIGDDDSWGRYDACQRRHPLSKYGHCLQLEDHFADNTFRVIFRGNC